MKSRIIDQGQQRSFAVVFETGEEVVKGLTEFVRSHRITAADFRGIGALSAAVLGYFQWDSKEYKRIPVGEQVEVVSLLGNVAEGPDGKPSLHPHIVLGRADGAALGGHLLEGHVRPVLEIVLSESPAHLRRRKDAESGLALLRP
jgi:predicted DNA-binding protein with PD1-like motif